LRDVRFQPNASVDGRFQAKQNGSQFPVSGFSRLLRKHWKSAVSTERASAGSAVGLSGSPVMLAVSDWRAWIDGSRQRPFGEARSHRLARREWTGRRMGLFGVLCRPDASGVSWMDWRLRMPDLSESGSARTQGRSAILRDSANVLWIRWAAGWLYAIFGSCAADQRLGSLQVTGAGHGKYPKARLNRSRFDAKSSLPESL
jgi:hypothetical protein